ncbi:hypothetical protein [Desulforhopalus singaporensis]|nr:hypothetical protein [Desulforhopalus singaporensis]
MTRADGMLFKNKNVVKQKSTKPSKHTDYKSIFQEKQGVHVSFIGIENS